MPQRADDLARSRTLAQLIIAKAATVGFDLL